MIGGYSDSPVTKVGTLRMLHLIQ